MTVHFPCEVTVAYAIGSGNVYPDVVALCNNEMRCRCGTNCKITLDNTLNFCNTRGRGFLRPDFSKTSKAYR